MTFVDIDFCKQNSLNPGNGGCGLAQCGVPMVAVPHLSGGEIFVPSLQFDSKQTIKQVEGNH